MKKTYKNTAFEIFCGRGPSFQSLSEPGGTAVIGKKACGHKILKNYVFVYLCVIFMYLLMHIGLRKKFHRKWFLRIPVKSVKKYICGGYDCQT